MKVHHLLLPLTCAACASTPPPAAAPAAPTKVEVRPAEALEWAALNPARGDKSPQAANVWGDRQAEGPTGFLVKFVDGFSSPPHIHNVSYRGIVVQGLVHNDDPAAANMWMPPGAYWTQPKGEPHITSARGAVNLAYIEIDEGPYLVRPVADAFDSGERPVNVDPRNLVWMDGAEAQWVDDDAGARLARLWADRDAKTGGSLVELPAGFRGRFTTDSPSFRAVVIQGEVTRRPVGEGLATPLRPGSTFHSAGAATHSVTCAPDATCLVYVRAVGPFRVRR